MHQECETSPILIFSHMKWNDIQHRPHHFGIRYAKFRKTYFFEDPEYSSRPSQVFYEETLSGVTVVKLSLNDKLSQEEELITLIGLMNQFLEDENVEDYTCLYFTPIPWNYTSHLTPEILMYDCLDQNLLGLHDPQEFDRRESELIQKSHIMSTHSFNLYQDKQYLHPNFHLIQNSVDYQLFSLARKQLPEPEDQSRISLPKIGYYGKIDDRLDFNLIDNLAHQRPDYQFIFLGAIETTKEKLPLRKNIHYLGKKNYHSIPSYIAHWNCSILPLNLTDEKLKINPIEIKELLAAGVPIIATNAIEQDMFSQRFNVLHIIESAQEMMNHIHKSIINDKTEWLNKVDRYLIGKSWNNSFLQLAQLERSLKHPSRAGNYPAYKDPSLTSIGIV